MSHAQGATARILIVAAGTIAAFFIADYIGLKALGLFIPPDAQGRITVSAITPGHGYAAAVSALANIAALALLVAALLWVIYARRPIDRAVVIAGGYVVACMAAALILLIVPTLFSELTRGSAPGSEPGQGGLERLASSFSILLSLSAAIGLFAFLPAAPIIARTERKQIRSLSYYLITGGAVGIVSFAIFLLLLFTPALSAWLTGTLPAGVQPTMRLSAVPMVIGWFLMFMLPGVGAGFTYWLVTGRTAGGDVAAATPSAEPHAG